MSKLLLGLTLGYIFHDAIDSFIVGLSTNQVEANKVPDPPTVVMD